MDIRIKDTGEYKTLSIIDANSGVDWPNDMIGNYGGLSDGQFVYDDDNGYYECDQDTYNWWHDLMTRYEAADNALYNYRQSLDDDGKSVLEKNINLECGVDLENMPEAFMAAIETTKEQLEEN